MQRNRALLAGRDGINGKLLPGVDIAAHKDIRLGGLVGHGVGLGGAVGVQFHSGAGQQALPVHLLPDAVQHHITGDFLGRIIIKGRGKAALGIADGKALAEADTAALAVFGKDLGLAPAGMDLNAVLLALGAVLHTHWHGIIVLQAVQRNLLGAAAQGRPGHIGTDIAADDHYPAGKLLLPFQVHFPHQLNTGLDTLGILAGHTQLAAALQSNGHIEALVALLPQFGDSHIPAYLHAAVEFHPQGPQHIDLGLNDFLLQPEFGDAMHQHTAGLFFLLKDGGTVALFRQVIGAGKAGRAATDNSDLLLKLAIHLGDDLFGNKAGLGVQVLLGNKALHLINGHRLVDGTAGTGVLAPPVADAAADRRERVIPLDELQSLLVLALGRQLQVALHRDVGGAGGLAGGGAGLVAVHAVLIAVVDRPLFGAPLMVVRQLLPGVGDGAVLGAQLLAQLHCASGAALHTAAAGHTVFAFHLGHIGAAGHSRRIKKLAGAQGVADIHIAVADSKDLLLAVDIGDLMDKAILLRPAENIQRFLLGDVLAPLGLHHIVGHIAHRDAPVFGVIAAALAQLLAEHMLLAYLPSYLSSQ